jgi:hypothetical protein
MTKQQLSVVLALGLLVSACQSKPSDGRLTEGSEAPRFSLPSAQGKNVRLDDFIGKKPVLLYFSMAPG